MANTDILVQLGVGHHWCYNGIFYHRLLYSVRNKHMDYLPDIERLVVFKKISISQLLLASKHVILIV